MSYSLKTVLLATELEPRSADIFRHAAGIAHQFNARLHVLTVVQSQEQALITDFISHETRDTIHADLLEQLRSEFQTHIERFCEAHGDLDARSLLAGQEVLEGNASQAILATAQRLGADLIVLGSHGHSALGEMLLGSVAHKVTLQARVPVLLVYPATSRR